MDNQSSDGRASDAWSHLEEECLVKVFLHHPYSLPFPQDKLFTSSRDGVVLLDIFIFCSRIQKFVK